MKYLVMVILAFSLEINSLILKGNKSNLLRTKLEEEKEFIERDINSMLLGNYLRRLMLKVKFYSKIPRIMN